MKMFEIYIYRKRILGVRLWKLDLTWYDLWDKKWGIEIAFNEKLIFRRGF